MSDNNEVELLSPSEWAAKIIRKVHETDEEFIFTTIQPFVDHITEIRISKEELVRAIGVVRIQREGLEKYGSSFSNDFYTATAQKLIAEKAYEKGFEDGKRSMQEKLNEAFNKGYEDGARSERNVYHHDAWASGPS